MVWLDHFMCTVSGIWPEGADGTDVNACCGSHKNTLMASADDFGKVNLFRYPCCQPKVGLVGVFSGWIEIKLSWPLWLSDTLHVWVVWPMDGKWPAGSDHGFESIPWQYVAGSDTTCLSMSLAWVKDLLLTLAKSGISATGPYPRERIFIYHLDSVKR